MHEGPFETQNVTGKPQTSAYMTHQLGLCISASRILKPDLPFVFYVLNINVTIKTCGICLKLLENKIERRGVL